MAWMLAAGAAAGTALSAYGQYRAGDSAKKQAKFQAAQMEQQANEVLSVSQRQALEYERQGRLQASRALAISAASGGGVSDPTVVDIMSNLAGETSYRKMSALYEGEQKASDLRLEAEAARQTGISAKSAGKLGAASTSLAGASSLYSNYGGEGWGKGIKGLWHQVQSKAAPGGPRQFKRRSA